MLGWGSWSRVGIEMKQWRFLNFLNLQCLGAWVSGMPLVVVCFILTGCGPERLALREETSAFNCRVMSWSIFCQKGSKQVDAWIDWAPVSLQSDSSTFAGSPFLRTRFEPSARTEVASFFKE